VADAHHVANGSGISFVVADSDFFQAGLAGIKGDLIQLQGQTVTAQLLASTQPLRTIMVNTRLTWTNGQGVALPYNGAAPDIGAFEFGANTAKPAP